MLVCIVSLSTVGSYVAYLAGGVVLGGFTLLLTFGIGFVGTSTFIMTFTALIAFISHVLIHPAIVMERWNVLILCVIVETVSSLLSAQFANRVSSKTVGRVTGVVLTVLGAVMSWE